MGMIIHNPLELVAEAYKNLYGDVDITVSFNPDIETESEMYVNADNEPKVIFLHYTLPVHKAVEILGHQLAHVKTGKYDDHSDAHGDDWEVAYDDIRNEFTRLVTKKVTNRKKIKIIRASEEDWYKIGEEYIVKDEELYKGIGIQIEVLKPEIARTDYIPDGDYEYIKDEDV